MRRRHLHKYCRLWCPCICANYYIGYIAGYLRVSANTFLNFLWSLEAQSQFMDVSEIVPRNVTIVGDPNWMSDTFRRD